MLPFRQSQQHKALKIMTSCLALMAGMLLWVKAYQSAFDLYKTPSELGTVPENNLRLGGSISPGSIKYLEDHGVVFALADAEKSIVISYQGTLPSLFQEGVQAIAVGNYDGQQFLAKELFVKHDQNYRLKKAPSCS